MWWFIALQTSANQWKSRLCFCVGRGFVATFSRSKRSSSTCAVKTLGCSAFVRTSTGKQKNRWQENNHTGVLHMLNTSYSKLTVLAYNYIMWVKDLIPQKNKMIVWFSLLNWSLLSTNKTAANFYRRPPIVLHRVPNFKTYWSLLSILYTYTIYIYILHPSNWIYKHTANWWFKHRLIHQ